MKKVVVGLCISLLIPVVISETKLKKIDYGSRKVTDKLLKVSSLYGEMPQRDLKAVTKGKDIDIEKCGDVFVHEKILKKRDIIVLHPHSTKKAATLDFSEITANNKGTLRISFNNHPGGDVLVKAIKDGKEVHKELLKRNKWEKCTVPFNKNKVVLEVHADQEEWCYEYAFIYYKITQ